MTHLERLSKLKEFVESADKLIALINEDFRDVTQYGSNVGDLHLMKLAAEKAIGVVNWEIIRAR